MGFLENIQLSKRANITRDTLDREGTAPLIFLNAGDIAVDTSNGGNIIDFKAESKTANYYPFDFLQFNNSSSSDINIYINQNTEWRKLVRAGTVVTITDFKGVHSVRISKIGAGTISAGEIETVVMRQPLSDDEFRRRELNKPLINKLLSKIIEV